MRISAKGQVTIPLEVRERMGFLPHTEVELVEEGATLRLLLPAKNRKLGDEIVRKLAGSVKLEYTADELMAITRGE